MAGPVKPPFAYRPHQAAVGGQLGGQRSGKTAAQLERLILEAQKHPGSRLEQTFDNMYQQHLVGLKRPGTQPEIVRISPEELAGVDQHILDALKYGFGASQTQVAPETPAIEKHTNAEMVMEMLRRGFAVMKLPEDGGPPEVFRGTTERE